MQKQLTQALKEMIDQYHNARLDGKSCTCLTCGEIVRRAEETLKAAIKSDSGAIVGYQAFGVFFMTGFIYAMAHGAFTVAAQILAGLR